VKQAGSARLWPAHRSHLPPGRGSNKNGSDSILIQSPLPTCPDECLLSGSAASCPDDLLGSTAAVGRPHGWTSASGPCALQTCHSAFGHKPSPARDCRSREMLVRENVRKGCGCTAQAARLPPLWVESGRPVAAATRPISPTAGRWPLHFTSRSARSISTKCGVGLSGLICPGDVTRIANWQPAADSCSAKRTANGAPAAKPTMPMANPAWPVTSMSAS
jgi:hypothetical protein